MKARISIILALAATAVAALTVASGAVLAPQQSTWTAKPLSIHGWDANRPGAVKPNPTGARLVRPNPSSIRGAARGW
jgi:hypothetical protein